jgi:hypothetical protein
MVTITLRKPIFRKELHISRFPYYMERSESNGEEDLFRIVKKATREHSWIFFPQTATWVSYVSNYTVSDGGLSVTSSLVEDSSFGTEQIYYHIHPDRAWSQSNEDSIRQTIREVYGDLEEEMIRILKGLPSEGDYKIGAEKLKGKEMRVLSSLGVFSLKGYINPSAPNYGVYSSFIANSLQIGTLRNAGIVPAIHEMVKNMNANSGSYVTLAFRPLV